MLITNKEISYRVVPYGFIATIPAGTPCTVASNLPTLPNGNDRYWACDWDGMTEQQESWQRNYGFLIEVEDITDADQSEPNEDMDGDHASALASAGFGTDEDYGGGDERF